MRLRKADVVQAYRRRDPTLQKRAREWFVLGYSVGHLLALCRGDSVTLLERTRQLLVEYEFQFHTGKGAAQNIKLMMAPDQGLFPNMRKPQLYKHGNKPVFTSLETVQLPGGYANYIEVVLSLCDVLSQLYARLASHAELLSLANMGEVLLSVDALLSRRFETVISEDMQDLAVQIMRSQQSQMASLLCSDQLGPTMFAVEHTEH